MPSEASRRSDRLEARLGKQILVDIGMESTVVREN